ncbi:unnamed protein product [Linum tenue]|uniref:Uncharacterized protein n=1 Tax=Linum tenue TaxID=586396 RepID=A0AAV0LHG4_9ROSI|nr:unnamed protein product [Linum tenue]
MSLGMIEDCRERSSRRRSLDYRPGDETSGEIPLCGCGHERICGNPKSGFGFSDSPDLPDTKKQLPLRAVAVPRRGSPSLFAIARQHSPIARRLSPSSSMAAAARSPLLPASATTGRRWISFFLLPCRP